MAESDGVTALTVKELIREDYARYMSKTGEFPGTFDGFADFLEKESQPAESKVLVDSNPGQVVLEEKKYSSPVCFSNEMLNSWRIQESLHRLIAENIASAPEGPVAFRVADYRKSDRYKKEAALRCPSCGEPSVFTETGEGDYYVGPSSICVSCGTEFTIQLGGQDLALAEEVAKND